MRDLGGQENVAARHAGGAHPFAHAALSTVFPSRVDVTIAELERSRDDLAAIAQGGGAKADSGDLGAVRGQCREGAGSHGLSARKGWGAHSTGRVQSVNRPLRGNTRAARISVLDSGRRDLM